MLKSLFSRTLGVAAVAANNVVIAQNLSAAVVLSSRGLSAQRVGPASGVVVGSRGFFTCVAWRAEAASKPKEEPAVKTQPRPRGLLNQLRKKTGFSFSNCKKALEVCGNDLTAAELWLAEEAQKQGWDKATKLAGRAANQGLIGVLHSPSAVAMIELNCETDFVSRNEKFHDLLDGIASGVLARSETGCGRGETLRLNADETASLPAEAGKTIRDAVALGVGNLGENMTLRRSVILRAAEDEHLASYVHAAVGKNVAARMGRFGAVLRYKADGDGGVGDGQSHASVARRLCQHVVGMNPQSLGDINDEVVKREVKDNLDELFDVEVKEGEDELAVSPEHLMSPTEKDDRFLFQEFIADPSLVVKEVVLANGIEILEFVRFECGETTKDQ